MIDLDIMPPDWKFAQQHAQAVRPGIAQSFYMRKGTNVYCQCCLKPVEKQPVPMTANSKQLQFLGFGFPLYFIYFKYSIILVLLLICSYSGVSLYWAIVSNENFCIHRLLSTTNQGDPHCTSFLIIFSRIEQQLSGEQIILRISSFLLHLFALIYIRDNIRKTYGYYDQRAKSLSHYSLVFKKLPLKNGIQHDIRQFINEQFLHEWLEYEQEFYHQHFKHEAQKVKQIILVPDLREYLKLQEEKKHFIQQKRKLLKAQSKQQKVLPQNQNSAKTKGSVSSNNSYDSQVSLVEEEIKKSKLKIKMMKKQIIQKAHADELQTQMAIVVLNTEIFKNTVLDFANKNKLNSNILSQYFGQFKGQIKIVRAPEPNEIIWENIHYSSHQRLVGKFIGWGLTIVFLAAVTAAFYFILVAKSNVLLNAIDQTTTPYQYHHSGSYYAAIFLVFVVMFLTVIFNKIVMSWALHHFTYFQKHENASDQQFSFCLKYSFGLFFTTALMTLAVQAITFHNFYTHQYGVIEQQSIMFFVNALFIPLFMLINPFQLKVLIVRKLNKNKKYFTQDEANKIMSDNPYVMGKQYAEIIESLWFTYLYATILPMGAFVMVIGLGLYYWTSKFNMLRRSSLRHNISGEMALHCLKLLDLTLMMKPLGQIIFDASIRDGVDASSIVMLCLGVLYFFLPMSIILQFFHGQKFQHSKKTYDEVKNRFVQTYETLHPIFNDHILQVFRTVERSLSKKISLTHISIPQAVDDSIVQKIDQALGSGLNLKSVQHEYQHSHYHSEHEIKQQNNFIRGGKS